MSSFSLQFVYISPLPPPKKNKKQKMNSNQLQHQVLYMRRSLFDQVTSISFSFNNLSLLYHFLYSWFHKMWLFFHLKLFKKNQLLLLPISICFHNTKSKEVKGKFISNFELESLKFNPFGFYHQHMEYYLLMKKIIYFPRMLRSQQML